MFQEDLMNQKRKEYEEMGVEELRALIRQDILENTLDEDSIQLITKELRRKNQKEHFFEEPHVDEAWKRFDKRLTAEFPIEKVSSPSKKVSPSTRKWMRPAITVAAMFVVIFMGSVTANAFGYNPITYIAKWTDEVFHFAPIVDSSTDLITFEELPALLEQYGVTDPTLPTWLPEKYEYIDCEIEDNIGWKAINITYENQNTQDRLSLTITTASNAIYGYSEKDAKDVVIYYVNGVEHYIMTNIDSYKATWQTTQCQCNLSGCSSIEDVKKIIDSIY